MADKRIVEQRSAAHLGGPKPLRYPDSDGQPMAENDEHYRAIQSIRAPLEVRFRNSEDTYVSGDLLLYYERGNPRKCVAPDVLVALGVSRGLKRTYLLWEEGKPPDFVAEVSSPRSRTDDRTKKRELYARLGVREYFLFDPVYEDDEHSGRLQGFRLWGDGSVEMGPGGAEGSGQELRSEVLGISLRPEHKRVRLRDIATGKDLLFFEETEDARQASEKARLEAEDARQASEKARLEAEDARRGVENERLEAEQARYDEVEARRIAEARVAELEALLGIRGAPSGEKARNE